MRRLGLILILFILCIATVKADWTTDTTQCLVCYFPFDGNVTDKREVCSAVSSLYTNSTGYNTTDSNTALDNSGNDATAYINMTANPISKILREQNVSITFWMKRNTETGASYQAIGYTPINRGMQVQLDGTGEPANGYFAFGNASTQEQWAIGGETNGQWRFSGQTFNSSKGGTYLDRKSVV